MTKRRSLVISLAPVSPPCFSSRDQWLVYLESAATAQREDHSPGPLRMTPQGPVFNRDFVFCEDCTAQHSHDMHRQRLCKPDYLKTLPELHTTLDEVADEPLGADEANPVTHQQSARGTHTMIYTKKQVQDAFKAACKTRDEFDAVEYVAQTLALPPEVVAEVVAEKATA